MNNNVFQKQSIPLMILNEERWHYVAVKKNISIIKRNNAKDNADFCCLYFLHSYATKRKLKSHK